MRALVIYRPNSEYGRQVEEYIADFQRRYPLGRIELMNIDSRDGSATATLYDVVQYPAILVIQDDGAVQNVWQGQPLPLMDDLAGYIRG
jgi:hypothetical protein